jgi:hypothetical protein
MRLHVSPRDSKYRLQNSQPRIEDYKSRQKTPRLVKRLSLVRKTLCLTKDSKSRLQDSRSRPPTLSLVHVTLSLKRLAVPTVRL